jgi:Ca2+-binding RTX toxin-like protein
VSDPDTIERTPIFTARLLDGTALPSWLTYAYPTSTFSGTPGTSNTGAWKIAVVSKDAGGLPVTDVFSLIVYDTSLARFGTSGNNSLTGTSGANYIDGGAGNDTMSGSGGNDIYIVDSTSDTVTEASGGGTDEIFSSVSITTLASNVEKLTLQGSANLNGTGNTLANTIVGNLGNNTLNGGGGDDTLYGGGGGTDVLVGGTGNDVYIVDSSTVTITENSGEGTDQIKSYVDIVLPANVENAVLMDSMTVSEYPPNINATGNSLANTLTGNRSRNVLDGGAGADTLIGGEGDDVYVVDTAGDSITDSSGIDEVRASLTWTLASSLENLTLLGTGNFNGTGNNNANVLVGNSGNNVLTGGLGADTLSGGGGTDTLDGGDGDDTYIITQAGSTIVEGEFTGTDTVRSSITITLADYVENLELTGTSNIDGTGNSLSNVITGNAGNNLLDGGASYDLLQGGLGNDVYVVDDEFDTVVENEGAGVDEVRSSISWTLGSTIENLTLTGSGAINGTGNASANVLVGNSGNNVLDGGAGDDSMSGGAGDDTYFVDSAGDTLTEEASAGYDTVQTLVTATLQANVEALTLLGSAAINGTGNSANNLLIGNSSANVLDGGAGADDMRGNDGDDTYIVDNAGDTVLEVSSLGGLDEVRSSVTFTLSANVERLILTGAGAVNGTGNADGNYIAGNSAANELDGAAGADILAGGAGDDIYFIDNVADVVFENAAEGTDEVRASVTHTLWGNIERLVLTGSSAINGTGNALANAIWGNAGDNLLEGKAGDDSLIGGDGADTYRYSGGDGADTIDNVSADSALDQLNIVGLTRAEFELSQDGDDLLIARIGIGTDSIRVTDWFAGAAHEIDFVQFSDETLTAADVNGEFEEGLMGGQSLMSMSTAGSWAETHAALDRHLATGGPLGSLDEHVMRNPMFATSAGSAMFAGGAPMASPFARKQLAPHFSHGGR